MLADRRAAIEGVGIRLADGIALEAESGLPTLEVARRGASRLRPAKDAAEPAPGSR
jgi:enoyl-CoA hydratase